MKKVLFALQIIGLLAMFPTYVILEMNHGMGRLKENNIQLRVKEQIENTGSEKSENYKLENVNNIVIKSNNLN